MTKTEYREYITSSYWQEKRKTFLAENGDTCNRCQMPRWLAEIAYDQDLNVHHKSYKNLGDEEWDDLESLCRKCHEVEKFGRSELREPKSATCNSCKVKHWNPYSDQCNACEYADSFLSSCVLCGSSVWSMPDKHVNFCGICKEISKADPKTIWKIADIPLFREGEVVGDIILYALLARLGVEKILNSLSLFEITSSGYNLKKMEELEEENEIPF